VTTIDLQDAFYWDSLLVPALHKKTGSSLKWRVLLANEERTVRRWVVFRQEERALEFIDAITSILKLRR